MQKKLPAKGSFSVVGDQTGECMERIESAENTKIKWAAALHMRKERERREEFVAEGIRLTETAAASSWPLLFCLVTETALQDARVQAIVAVLDKRQCHVYLVSQAAYKKASATNTPQGILLVMKRKTVSLSSLRAKETPFLAVLDKVQDPGNAGPSYERPTLRDVLALSPLRERWIFSRTKPCAPPWDRFFIFRLSYGQPVQSCILI